MVADSGAWDGYRTTYPFLALSNPDTYGWMAQGFVNAYLESGAVGRSLLCLWDAALCGFCREFAACCRVHCVRAPFVAHVPHVWHGCALRVKCVCGCCGMCVLHVLHVCALCLTYDRCARTCSGCLFFWASLTLRAVVLPVCCATACTCARVAA
jgi:hypothetical protein